MKAWFFFVLSLPMATLCAAQKPNSKKSPAPQGSIDKIEKTDAEWKKSLSPEAYNVLRKEGTERAYTGAYWDHHEKGTYACAGCKLPLFSSDTKFESGTGWPSFYQPIAAIHVREQADNAHGMRRTEVECSRCGGHLGHVFNDGPKPTGLRYCMNSAALSFIPAKKN